MDNTKSQTRNSASESEIWNSKAIFTLRHIRVILNPNCDYCLTSPGSFSLETLSRQCHIVKNLPREPIVISTLLERTPFTTLHVDPT
ncbi:hypothetical protein CYMTET_12814 [Cymbomonas tetramitiformis]|uniref:Uncharacterized protein n=1 Tax=Cymbomonas tetramitiformis TaxID=36881 RepID=A0AAE0GJX9_9CHLO|nr:hypothetical protein CYMTET_12814 [Cymbomonas tetramitiformis]